MIRCQLSIMDSLNINTLNQENMNWAKTIVAEFFICVTCLIGDAILNEPVLLKYPWSRALSDTFTHGLVALWSWAVIYPQLNLKTLFEIFLCFALAVIVDIDHFIAAGSIHIHNATHLDHRPPFHNSTIIIFVTLLLLMFAHTMPPPISRLVDHLPWIYYIAWSSHHIRDATRRGLWFWPVGSTIPIPKVIYILSIMLQAFLMKIYLVSRHHSKINLTPKLLDV